ncbi:MAG: protein TolQ [Paracoccus sp. (in: a-proteobacteria)]|jgi:biopolymer transport protein TolQ|uniref:protein TolQ n=1 Tax=unclassified Paracoccus (in: a-proteobacteria) TaxID=2688777 RepID=UPI000C39EC8E|nr:MULTISPECIES: protein TolQ [unclassified Paracoccus (in: a-proteobacteria)]MBA49541.1 protein TolQ [Paracoccus sp. (in: a-proteobacteria)]MDB2552698.1 protein TolQ [Paracoccus sp. (in: a-proteobacteria)]|tara:strand:- start:1210 stop:1905 length:696 start_codon:yes stop_codon:yes gene_type:complete
MEPIQAAQALDFSLLALFARASLTVKVVMVLLIVASVWSWAIIIQKFLAFAAARREQIRFDRAFWSGEPLDDVYDRLGETPSGATERVFAAGMTEWRRSHRDDGALIPGGTQRIDRAMNVAIQREETRLFRGLSFLATVGSTAPFIGLFGTVWGIKTAFEGIAMSQDTSLAVVAPGIAEALLATALGLLAAIPAVVFYNKLSGDAERVTGNWEAFSDEFSTLLSRQLDSEV